MSEEHVAQGKSNDREARTRLRGYQARQSLHRSRQKRRVRDNVIAALAAVVVIGLAVVAQLLYFSSGPGAPVAGPTPASTPTPAATGENTGDVPSSDIAEGRDWTGTLSINEDPLGITLAGAAAPQAVSSFISLTQSGFYDGVSCHRLTTEGLYVLQCGDPDGDGTGGPGYSYGPVENAPADGVYPAGTIAMARQGGNGYSQGSQFFVVYQDTTLPSDAAGGYTVLGQVTSGLDALVSDVVAKGTADGSGDGAPAEPVIISSVSVQ
ncbi:peptidylprolyl isomerase [Rathayibacter rathayi]|uniref:peptidylprolyl isomerase n=1 Tax=Rathayibacter rathayi TaxID=33887 RepID=A0ABX5AC52_RATRA|nr:peptidylprolyl isomerase [Rathayibacter rathayi]PPG89956.1 peptidylprolyl isomerase [Rathayibacter rathayi]PPG93632.1 peptidylprolyl isomerase [Rathayibacter rathayi]PPG94472.1 peptidylprolyl isomerase [Rathayibacter rathayi]PPH75747.1 peptidylprolyl isomerase [Rathayibacter rathayi]